MRSRTVGLLAVAMAAATFGAPVAGAQDDGSGASTTLPAAPPPAQATAPLVAVPPGCATLPLPSAVFVGTLIAHDLTTARFRVDQLRAGSTTGWEFAGQIDVRFGNEVRFLDVNGQYLVGAAVDPSTGALSSKVAPHAPLFGGSSVIGLNESDIDCPVLEDGVRTLHVDGTSIDSGVLTPLRNSKRALLGAVVKPMAWSFLALLVLVAMKHLIVGFVRSMRGIPGETPVPRPRRHRAGDPLRP